MTKAILLKGAHRHLEMKTQLLDFLICPACLPDERELTCDVLKSMGDDIILGSLQCSRCGTTYPIREGIGVLLLDPSEELDGAQAKYESPAVVSSYMWSHYADLWEDEDASAAYRDWGKLLRRHSGFSLDAGCAVGRFTFEMSLRSDFAVGIDRSYAFVRAAKGLLKERTLEIVLAEEGVLTEVRKVCFPEKWDTRKIEFLVADAQALPFRSHHFSSLASLNLVDKVPRPGLHLREINRIAREKDAQFLFSDPFSWSTDIADEKDWLGGTGEGAYSGRGIENIAGLLTGKKGSLTPFWQINKRGEIWWKIRNHRNHFELIRSCFIHASR